MTRHDATRGRLAAIVAAGLVASLVGLGGQAKPAPIDVARYAGLYVLPDGAPLFVWSAAEGQLTFGFGQGEVRGLAGSGDAWTYGTSLGVTTPPQGRLRFVREGRRPSKDLVWEPAGGAAVTARRARLAERDVTFTSGDVTLAGAVIAPDNPRAGIVFLHGAGAETREPSRVFAYLLAREGIASLIFDKRASGRSTGETHNVAFAEFARDAGVAMITLRRELGQPAMPVGLFGPSQGSWVALVASGQSPQPAFLVLQSGDATSPLDQILHQGRHLFQYRGQFSQAEIEESVVFRRQKYLYLITGEGQAEFEQALAKARETRWLPVIGEFLPNAGFWKPNGLFDPMPALRAFRGPVLAVFGALDVNKDVALNARLMTEALDPGANPANRVVIIPDANHGIFETRTGLPLERELPRLTRLAPRYLETLTSWMRDRLAGRDGRAVTPPRGFGVTPPEPR